MTSWPKMNEPKMNSPFICGLLLLLLLLLLPPPVHPALHPPPLPRQPPLLLTTTATCWFLCRFFLLTLHPLLKTSPHMPRPISLTFPPMLFIYWRGRGCHSNPVPFNRPMLVWSSPAAGCARLSHSIIRAPRWSGSGPEFGLGRFYGLESMVSVHRWRCHRRHNRLLFLFCFVSVPVLCWVSVGMLIGFHSAPIELDWIWLIEFDGGWLLFISRLVADLWAVIWWSWARCADIFSIDLIWPYYYYYYYFWYNLCFESYETII